MSGFSVYIHIPFCAKKCPYCDFNTYAVSELPEEEYTDALISELDHYASDSLWKGRTIKTIYFGGGTPSLFSASAIRSIVSYICRSFPVDHLAEISLEANPGSVDQEKLGGYREAGINRLSFGAQSFDRDVLSTLGRTHSASDIEWAVANANQAGFRNISLDLIFGVPGQTQNSLIGDIQRSIDLGVQHISAYGLTVEKGTPFYQAYKRKAFSLPDDDLVLKMMDTLVSLLTLAGFEHYEISNFARPHRRARHNLAYWDGCDYLGLGAGAHSFARLSGPLFGKRWCNLATPDRYIKSIKQRGSASSWREELSREESVFEYFFLGLRKIEGVSLKRFKEYFGDPVQRFYPALIEVLTDQGFISIEGDALRLTAKGLAVADSVIENFASPEIFENKAPVLRVLESECSDLALAANEKF